MKFAIFALWMGHLVYCNSENPNYPDADMTPEEKGLGADRLRKLRPVQGGYKISVHPKKEYEEFMHKLPERCFLIQGTLKNDYKYSSSRKYYGF